MKNQRINPIFSQVNKETEEVMGRSEKKREVKEGNKQELRN